MDEMSESSRWENELEKFHEVLANPKGQAIVIVGPAGSGKSTLLTMMVTVAKKLAKFEMAPSWRNLPGLILTALRS